MSLFSVPTTYGRLDGHGHEGEHFLSQHLSANGDGTGVRNMNGTYTLGTGDGVFYIQPPATDVWYIELLMVDIEDTAMAADTYGNINLGAGNGMLLYTTKDGPLGTITWDILDNEPLTTNVAWAHLAYSMTMYGFASSNTLLAARLEFDRISGGSLVLDGAKEDCIVFVCQDTLTGLIDHNILAQGLKVVTPTRNP